MSVRASERQNIGIPRKRRARRGVDRRRQPRPLYGDYQEEVKFDKIADWVCCANSITGEQLFSRRRTQKICQARWLLWWLAFEFITDSPSRVARMSRPGTHHGTVIAGVARFREILSVEADFAATAAEWRAGVAERLAGIKQEQTEGTESKAKTL